MSAAVDVVECPPGMPAAALLDELRRERAADFVLLVDPRVTVGVDAHRALVAAGRAPLAASVSPIPAGAAPADEVVAVATVPHLPPAPTLAAGCPRVNLLARNALASVGLDDVPGATCQVALAAVWRRLTEHGWRHVGAPGTALDWAATGGVGAGDRALLAELDGPANEGLTTHTLWAETRLRSLRIAVDGACLTDSPHNGSQAVVINVARALKRVRPGAAVTLAVPDAYTAHIGSLVGADGVQVVARTSAASGFDVVYRPYQLIDPNELDWLVAAGARLVVSQLDMIAFSNPSYHPSATLFHAVRNLQRHTLRLADGVTFISEFGRATALAECPDLDVTRTRVVSCGADAEPLAAATPSAEVAARVQPPFIACTSATFWHKNREHAIATFAETVRRHAYRGSLVIAGPEPYYGRSADAEQRLLAELDADIAARVIRLGQVDEPTKWWLLGAADLVLYPSVVEGFGLVPFEAAGVGTPTLVPAGSALGELLGGTPVALSTWDTGHWAAAAAALVEDSGAARLAVAAVREVATRHTWVATAELTWDSLDAAVARPRAERHAEEGGLRSRVAPVERPAARTTKVAHFANRLVSYLERRSAAGPRRGRLLGRRQTR